MTMSTSRRVTGFKYAATLLGAFAVLAIAPATSYATVKGDEVPPPNGGCVYYDADDNAIPMDNGQSVVVDGHTVHCSKGVAIPVRNKGPLSRQA
jgi:hypothetical protein